MKIRNHKHRKPTRWVAPYPNWQQYEPRMTLISKKLDDDLIVLRLKELDLQKIAWQYCPYTGSYQSSRFVVSSINDDTDISTNILKRKTFSISHKKAVRRIMQLIKDGEL